MADYRINSLVLAAGPLSSSPTSATKSARNGPDLPVWRGPLIGVDRKWLVEAQNDANDLHETLVVRRNELFRGAIQPSSRLTRFVINCAFS
jgi:hypothetical protein